MKADRKRFKELYACRRFSTAGARRLPRLSCPGKEQKKNTIISRRSRAVVKVPFAGERGGGSLLP